MAKFEGVLAMAEAAVEELITRYKADEAVSDLEKQLDQREKFYSLVSHDLRSPLAVIKASAELIRRIPPTRPELYSTLVDRILESVNRADRMVIDLLDVNRFQAGLPLPLARAECDLTSIARKLVADLSVVHLERLRFEGASAIVGTWDSRALQRAIENLANNALKYGDPSRPVAIRVWEADDEASVSVHNYGSPIPPNDLSNLFQWYGRTAAAQNSGKAGWGLGLMLVKAIVEAHQGSVTVESDAERGTTFTITVRKAFRP